MALKLGGNNPGQRLNATTATKTNGSQRFHFSFTVLKISPAGKNYKNRCSRDYGAFTATIPVLRGRLREKLENSRMNFFSASGRRYG
jgi:hypothetical protein